jgi:hypothetical protein
VPFQNGFSISLYRTPVVVPFQNGDSISLYRTPVVAPFQNGFSISLYRTPVVVPFQNGDLIRGSLERGILFDEAKQTPCRRFYDNNVGHRSAGGTNFGETCPTPEACVYGGALRDWQDHRPG